MFIKNNSIFLDAFNLIIIRWLSRSARVRRVQESPKPHLHRHPCILRKSDEVLDTKSRKILLANRPYK
jgi:hypothetical protein